MGDKGGKKDRDKHERQHVKAEQQVAQRKIGQALAKDTTDKKPAPPSSAPRNTRR